MNNEYIIQPPHHATFNTTEPLTPHSYLTLHTHASLSKPMSDFELSCLTLHAHILLCTLSTPMFTLHTVPHSAHRCLTLHTHSPLCTPASRSSNPCLTLDTHASLYTPMPHSPNPCLTLYTSTSLCIPMPHSAHPCLTLNPIISPSVLTPSYGPRQ